MINQDVDNLESRLNQMDRKLDALNARLAAADERELRPRPRPGASRMDRTFWGIFLIVLGGLWLADRMEWIDISAGWLLPSLLLGFGLYLILGGRER